MEANLIINDYKSIRIDSFILLNLNVFSEYKYSEKKDFKKLKWRIKKFSLCIIEVSQLSLFKSVRKFFLIRKYLELDEQFL